MPKLSKNTGPLNIINNQLPINQSKRQAPKLRRSDCEYSRLLLQFFDIYSPLGLPLLHAAALKGDVSMVKNALKQESDINEDGCKHGTPLHAAALNGNIDIARLLVNRGADIDAPRKEYYGTPLHAAALNGNIDIVRLLLNKGADIDAPGTMHYGTPLFEAALKGNIDIVRLLIDKGAYINAPGAEYYGTPLHGAALNGHKAILELLLEKGADVNIDCGTFGTPLQAAVSFNRKEVALRLVTLLLANGANINEKGGDTGNAL